MCGTCRVVLFVLELEKGGVSRLQKQGDPIGNDGLSGRDQGKNTPDIRKNHRMLSPVCGMNGQIRTGDKNSVAIRIVAVNPASDAEIPDLLCGDGNFGREDQNRDPLCPANGDGSLGFRRRDRQEKQSGAERTLTQADARAHFRTIHRAIVNLPKKSSQVTEVLPLEEKDLNEPPNVFGRSALFRIRIAGDFRTSELTVFPFGSKIVKLRISSSPYAPKDEDLSYFTKAVCTAFNAVR